MRSLRVTLRLSIAIILVAISLLSAIPAGAVEDYALVNGTFFTETGNRTNAGFAVRDEGLDARGRPVRFWAEFQRFGGVGVLGYPISRVYRGDDGFTYQLFQRALLQWRSDNGHAVFANILDHMSMAGDDPWLAGFGIPQPIADDGSNGDFALAVRTRLGWLTEPRIKTFFLSASPTGDSNAAIERYGLPSSLPVRSGPFVVQRFQRVVLQLWVDNVTGMPAAGTVVPVLAGDLYRQRAIDNGVGVADGRFVPEPMPGTFQPSARSARPASIDPRLEGPLQLLAENPAGAEVAAALRAPGVKVQFADVPAIAMFSPAGLNVSVDDLWQGSDPKALAAVLAHEGSHLNDYLRGVDMISANGCYATEFNAFQTQARVWDGFYGPRGKPQPANTLDRELNRILADISQDAQSFASTVLSTYRGQCGA